LTYTPVNTETSTATATKTFTATVTNTEIPTGTLTNTETYTATNTFTNTVANTNTAMPTNTKTNTASNTATHTPSLTQMPSATFTPNAVHTPNAVQTQEAGVNEEIKIILIYPNPVNKNCNEIKIKTNLKGKQGKIRIYTSAFRLVKEEEINIDEIITVSTKELLRYSNGAYTVQIGIKEGTRIKWGKAKNIIILK
jgi:hypothetical protein